MTVAIVAEGGGQRGIYTAGVLDAFLDDNFNPFQIGLGVSAGAQNLLAYFIGERGYAKKAITELTSKANFFGPQRLFGEDDVLDLNQYFDTTALDPDYEMPYEGIVEVQQNRQLIFVAAQSDDLTPVYLHPDDRTVIDYLKASSAIPFLYQAPPIDQGQLLIDGGVADPIPVCKAIELGAKHIVVIRTISPEAAQSDWALRVSTLPVKHILPNRLMEMLVSHEAGYTQALEMIRTPPAGVTITQIAPEQVLQSSAFGSNAESMMADYESGYASGTNVIGHLQSSLPS